jgi:hypothetical protein
MYSEIVDQYSYDVGHYDFGIGYWVEGEDRNGDPFEASILLGFIYSEEDGGYYLTCSVIWNGVADYTDYGEVLIDEESMESGRVSSKVKREMDRMIEKLLKEYPEFEDIDEFLGW